MPRSFLIKKHFGCPLKKRLLLAAAGNRQPTKDAYNDRLQPEDLRSSPRSPPEASGPEVPSAVPVSTPPPGVTLIARSADDPKSMLLDPLTVNATWSTKNVIPPYLPFSFAALYPAAFPQQGTDYYSNPHSHQHPPHPPCPPPARRVPPLYPTSSPPPLRTAALPDPDPSPYPSRVSSDVVRPKTAPLAPLPVDAAGKNSNSNHHSPGNGIGGSTSPFLYHHQMWEDKPARENKECSSDADSDHSSLKKRREAPRYQCSDCNKSYSTFSGLTKHQQFHCVTQTKRTFSCKYCEKVYVSLGALKMHIRTHTLPCKCKLCGKAFSRPWLLQGHIRTHTGEKPFACQHCNRAFADRSNLRAHLQTHSDVKKYSCKNCSKTFSRMSLLSKHEDGGCSCPQL